MLNKLVNFIIFLALSLSALLINYQYPSLYVSKFAYSFLAVAGSYLFFKVFLEEAVSRRISNSKARYSFRKTTQFLFLLVSAFIILRIWVLNTQTILVVYGLFTAGIAIALQDVFKNFAGALAIFMSGIYSVGDRVEIDSQYGDVIDIGLFYTSLLEIREWVDGEQATGRIVEVPNGKVLFTPVHNYTKDHNFIWDEFTIPISYKSDWQQAIKVIKKILKKETAKNSQQASRGISRLEERYYLSKHNIDADVFITLTDNWIQFNLRYVVEVRERRLVKNRLSILILKELEKQENIEIASETLVVTSMENL